MPASRTMSVHTEAARQRLRTPRAAAFAGIAFSILLMASMSLVWTSIPPDLLQAEADLARNARRLSLALDLLPFAGIAFLWFIGVLRDRLGDLEDRFFATVFLGSGLLFLAMIFAGAAVAGGVVAVLGEPGSSIPFGAYALARIQIHRTMRVYAMRMAGVFMMSAATISLRTRIVSPWIAYLGYGLAVVLLFGGTTMQWIPLAFPLWVLLVSAYILVDNLRRRPSPGVGPAERPAP